MKPLAGPKRTKFVRMLLHHYVWQGRGEDYDKFKVIQTSSCLSFKSKLTMIFVLFYDFPMGSMSFDDFPMLPSGVWVYYIVAKWGRLYWFGFGVQSKWERSSRIGLMWVLNGTVHKYYYTIWLWVSMSTTHKYGCEWLWVQVTDLVTKSTVDHGA
jgi:hypothetical protein